MKGKHALWLYPVCRSLYQTVIWRCVFHIRHDTDRAAAGSKVCCPGVHPGLHQDLPEYAGLVPRIDLPAFQRRHSSGDDTYQVTLFYRSHNLQVWKTKSKAKSKKQKAECPKCTLMSLMFTVHFLLVLLDAGHMWNDSMKLFGETETVFFKGRERRWHKTGCNWDVRLTGFNLTSPQEYSKYSG